MNVKQKHHANSFENETLCNFVYLNMLKTLSYINISLALIYYVSYLINSYSFAALGIWVIVAYNGVVIRSIERELKFGWLHYSLGFLSVVFAGILITWIVNIILSSLAYNYFNNSWLYIAISVIFIFCILWQLVLAWLRRANIRSL